MGQTLGQKINPRGRAAIQECERYGLCILNGTSLETCSPGRLTSWQEKGESVIDYAIVSENALPLVRRFDVACPAPDPDDDWADHMRICLTVDSAMFKQAPSIPRERQGAPEFRGSEHIDELYQATMDSKQITEDALKSLWGPVMAQSVPLRLYVEGASSKDNNRGGAGIFFGPGSPQNRSVKVPGPGRLTADRSRLFAIHEAIRAAPDDKSLLIFCTSKMISRQTCFLAAKNNQLGWPGNNGDIFKSIVKLLAMRRTTSCFVHIDSKADNDAKREAYSQAKSALNLPGPCEAFIPITNIAIHADIQFPDAWANTRKVYTDLEEKSPVKPKLWRTGEDTATPDKDPDRSHRGRAKVHALQFGLRKELLSCKEPKEL
jgi:ribonuclease HI